MLTIHKFELEITDVQTIGMRADAKILHVDNQNGTLCIWALLSTSDVITERRFYIFGTGHQVPRIGLKHIGSVLMDEFVWHVFEESFI